MLNATFQAFGWPETSIAELDHWGVMLRPAQPTLGALALVCKQPVTAFSDVDAAGFADLQKAIAGVEAMLRATTGYEKINYLMLMMNDPDVHFHVIPRYEGTRSFAGEDFPDHGWPGPPALGQAVKPKPETTAQLVALYRARWQLPA
ncbi:MAG: HIT family protein [Alphaproteobacteria bacterium]